ncbi:hypothetical protein KTH_56500 [Thermosporothrix hazakensis]|jgi:hypothetical protein|nr:hypothetical protein KTH_56500 [Thermosporothrix hazakensis]
MKCKIRYDAGFLFVAEGRHGSKRVMQTRALEIQPSVGEPYFQGKERKGEQGTLPLKRMGLPAYLLLKRSGMSRARR